MRPSGKALCVVGLVFGLSIAESGHSATSEAMTLFQAERSLIQLCDLQTQEALNDSRARVGEVLSAFEQHLALCRVSGRQVGWEAVEAFRKAAERYRSARLHHRDLMVRWYELILQARPNHRDAAKMEYDAARQFDLDYLHFTDDKASPTEALRRYLALVEKYPLTLDVYHAHYRIGLLSWQLRQIDLAKRHVELMIATPFSDIRGPRPMSEAQWRQKFGFPEGWPIGEPTLESMEKRFEGLRQGARRLFVYQCVQMQCKTVEAMQAEYDRLRAKFPDDAKLAAIVEIALKQGPKGK